MFEKLILTKTAATFVGTGALEMEFAGAFGLPEKWHLISNFTNQAKCSVKQLLNCWENLYFEGNKKISSTYNWA